MKRIRTRIRNFFFSHVGAQGFGLMRILWAATILRFFIAQIGDVSYLYSERGIVPPEYMHLMVDEFYRWNLLDFIQSPQSVRLLFSALLASAFCMMIGLCSKTSTLLSVLLFMCFAERAPVTGTGGHIVMRVMGVMLILAPDISAFSVDRLQKQWRRWKKDRTLLPIPTMSSWPFRLVLYQLMVIYLFTLAEKVLGTSWWDGLAPGIALHHTHFTRFPLWVADYLSPLSPFIAGYTLTFDLGWALLLIPAKTMKRLTRGHLRWETMKRFLLLAGVGFHLGIHILMDVSLFSYAMITAYCGALLGDDFRAMRDTLNRKWSGKKIHVLYDDNCRLCRRSAFTLLLLDFLHRLDFVNFHHQTKRTKIDASLRYEELDKAMHIKLPSGKVLKGFVAVRELARHLPVLWPLWPLLHLPGVEAIGHRVYEWVAARRLRCTDDSCRI